MNRLTNEIRKSKEVIATFRLSQNSLDAIDWLTVKLEITKKQLFNSIWENQADTIVDIIKRGSTNKDVERYKKSQRISKRCLENIIKISKRLNMKRDNVVESTFISYKYLYEFMIEKNIEKHKAALKLIDNFWGKAEKIEKQLSGFLEKNDPVLERFGLIIIHLMNLSLAIEDEIEKGILLEPETDDIILIEKEENKK